ncbi:hypothetical protein FBR05_05345 [Deltaproteobacteria bacterium PRO3]|nr:hypothetical protein [Deltaproteobacteria bacterium PRO3]
MTQTVSQPKANALNQDPATSVDELYYGEDYDFTLEEEAPAEESSFQMQPTGLTVDQLRGRLSSLVAMVEQSDLTEESKSALLREIQVVQSQINFAQSLSPAQRDAEFSRLYLQIGQIESKFAAGGAVDAAGGSEDVEGGTDVASLQKRRDECRKQIDKLEAKGWITEELHEKLSAKLDRVSDLVSDPDFAEEAAALIEELEGNIDGVKQMYVEEGEAVEALEGESAEVKDGSLKALLQMAGVSEEQAMAAFKAAFPGSEISSAKDLAKAIEKEEAPFTAPPSAEVIKFLEGIDAEFAQSVASANRWEKTVLGSNLQKAASRLTALLTALYGNDHIIRVTQPETQNGYEDWRLLNEITFDGTSYSFTREEKGQTTRVAWEVLDANSKPAPAKQGGSGKGGLPDVPSVPGPGDEIANKGKDLVEDGIDAGTGAVDDFGDATGLW